MAGKGTFWGRVDRLSEMVGDGSITGRVVVDQPYAAVQHERTDYNHPKGGEAKYLERPLTEKYESYLRGLAEDALGLSGSSIEGGMAEVVEDLAGEAARRAPVETGALRQSVSSRVERG